MSTMPTAPAKSAPHASRYIPAQVRREVWREANGRCTYRDPASGKLCGSTFKLQIEHLDPYAMGGSSRDPANLTLLCAAHNQMKAARQFGDWQKNADPPSRQVS
jgi:5-methylcytosine-specific restriction endonuclease McrA